MQQLPCGNQCARQKAEAGAEALCEVHSEQDQSAEAPLAQVEPWAELQVADQVAHLAEVAETSQTHEFDAQAQPWRLYPFAYTAE